MHALPRAALLLALPALLAPAAPQGRREEAIEAFKKEREEVLIRCGQRHLEYALELRDRGLTLQAATQFVLAVDASEGRNQRAGIVLNVMRQFEEAFWKRRRAKPTPAKLEAYAKQAAKLRLEDQEARVALARFAERQGLEAQALGELREVLSALDEPLRFDERGRLLVAGGEFDGPLVERVRQEAITINGQLYVRDTFLRRLPQVAQIYEHASAALRVRSTESVEEARELHAAATQLLERLNADYGVVPERRLQIVVLGQRKTYAAYLDLSSLSSHKAVDGFADRVAATAVLCKEGSSAPFVLGLALHELVHLHQLSVSPAAFPSWYMEASAETHGGEGTFRWDGTTLSTGGLMPAARLDPVRAAPFPLRELLTTDALALWKDDPATARRFYAQSWAFLRFLEQGAGAEIAARLQRWRDMCLGSVLGADLYKSYAMDAAHSTRLFGELFEPDLARLEAEFRVYLAGL